MEYLNSPLFGIAITFIAYEIGIYMCRKIKLSFLSPFLISVILIMLFLYFFKIPMEYYKKGGSMVKLLLIPATSALAISMYNKVNIIKKNLIPVIIGCFVGSLSSVSSIFIMCKLFKLDLPMMYSMLPKSVTVPIAMDLASKNGGIVAITIACVCLTGVLGGCLSPLLIKKFKLKNPIATGLAIGTSSHGIGTARAIEIGETEGALSSIAIGMSGIMTVIIFLFL